MIRMIRYLNALMYGIYEEIQGHHLILVYLTNLLEIVYEILDN